jgi:ribosomal protein S27AE
MAEQTCPSCGNVLPDALAQHADNLEVGLVTCPSCGAGVTLRKESAEPSSDYARATAAPPGRSTGEDSFSGNDDFDSLRQELREK